MRHLESVSDDGGPLFTEADIQRLEGDAARWKAEHPSFADKLLVIDASGDSRVITIER